MADTWVGSSEMYGEGEKCPNLGCVLGAGLSGPADGLVRREKEESRMT